MKQQDETDILSADEQGRITRATGKEYSSCDRLKQVGLFAILGSGRWRQMLGSEKFGLGAHRLRPLCVKKLDGWGRDDKQVCSQAGEVDWDEPVTVKQIGMKTLIK